MTSSKVLQNLRTRQRTLQIIRNTGQYQYAWKALGLSESTFRRYREKHPDFDEMCDEAKAFHEIQREIKYGVRVREKALKEIEKRIDEGTVKDGTLIHILFNQRNEIL